MKWHWILAALLLLESTVINVAEAARRRTFDGAGNVLIERGRPRALARRVTEFNGTVRYGRAHGGGPRGFAAPAVNAGLVQGPVGNEAGAADGGAGEPPAAGGESARGAGEVPADAPAAPAGEPSRPRLE